MNHELLGINSQDVKQNLVRIPEGLSYTYELAHEMDQVVVGQEKATKAVAGRMVLAESRMNDPERPLSTMFFLGGTGVGKTEMAHAMSEALFGNPNSEQLKIINCAEYAQPHMTTRLTGAPPSYVGWDTPTAITEQFLANRNIIVFDEIEKAHPSLHRLLLGVMETGKLAIKNGRDLSFANSHIVITSNVGAGELQKARKGNKSIGFGPSDLDTDLEGVGRRALERQFADMPEFLGRLDSIVVFDELKPKHYEHIFWKFLDKKNKQLVDRLEGHAPFITATTEARNHFIESIDKTYGARDLRGVMDREIFERIADLFIQVDLTGRPVVVDVEEGKTVFYTDSLDPTPPVAPTNIVDLETQKKNESGGANTSPFPRGDDDTKWYDAQKARGPYGKHNRTNSYIQFAQMEEPRTLEVDEENPNGEDRGIPVDPDTRTEE